MSKIDEIKLFSSANALISGLVRSVLQQGTPLSLSYVQSDCGTLQQTCWHFGLFKCLPVTKVTRLRLS